MLLLQESHTHVVIIDFVVAVKEMVLSPRVKQVILGLGCLLNMMAFGMMLGFPAILLPSILDPNSDIYVEKNTAFWIVALPGISGLLPVFILAPVMRIYGRRFSNLCLTFLLLLGWIMCSLAYSITLLIISRLLTGLVSGAIYFFSVCLGEFSCPAVRGPILYSKVIFASLGTSIIHVCGLYLHWRKLALIPIIPTSIALIITFFWPDTPDWLVTKGRYAEAEVIFYSIRGRDLQSEKEIKYLIESLEAKKSLVIKRPTFCQLIKELNSGALWRPVILLICAIFLPEFGGRSFFPTYSLQLLIEISGKNDLGFIYVFTVDFISVVGPIIGVFFVSKVYRRKLVLGSGFSAVVILLVIATLLVLSDKHILEGGITNWILIIFLCIYSFLIFSALFNVCYLIMGELFPIEYREIGAIFDGTLGSLCFASMARLIPVIIENITIYGMLFLFASVLFIILVYFYFQLPETKDRTLQDIGDYFKGLSPKINYSITQKPQEEETNIFLPQENKP